MRRRERHESAGGSLRSPRVGVRLLDLSNASVAWCGLRPQRSRGAAIGQSYGMRRSLRPLDRLLSRQSHLRKRAADHRQLPRTLQAADRHLSRLYGRPGLSQQPAIRTGAVRNATAVPGRPSRHRAGDSDSREDGDGDEQRRSRASDGPRPARSDRVARDRCVLRHDRSDG